MLRVTCCHIRASESCETLGFRAKLDVSTVFVRRISNSVTERDRSSNPLLAPLRSAFRDVSWASLRGPLENAGRTHPLMSALLLLHLPNNLARAESGIRTRAACSFCRNLFDPFGYQHSWFIDFHEMRALPFASVMGLTRV